MSKNFGKICLVQSPLIYSSFFICAIDTTLSYIILLEPLIKDNSQDFRIYFIIDFNYTHSPLAS